MIIHDDTFLARLGSLSGSRGTLVFVFVFLVFIFLVKLRVVAHFLFFLFRNLSLKVLDVFKEFGCL